MTRKRVGPALLATIVMSPLVALQLVLFLLDIGTVSPSDAVGVAGIDALFWYVNFSVWRHIRRTMSDSSRRSAPRADPGMKDAR